MFLAFSRFTYELWHLVVSQGAWTAAQHHSRRGHSSFTEILEPETFDILDWWVVLGCFGHRKWLVFIRSGVENGFITSVASCCHSEFQIICHVTNFGRRHKAEAVVPESEVQLMV